METANPSTAESTANQRRLTQSLWIFLLAVVLLIAGLELRFEIQAGENDAPPKEKATPPMAIAPFDAKTAKQHQAAWAKHLGTKVVEKNSIGMELVLIPPGKFMMGSPESDTDVRDNEKPQVLVKLTKPFYLGTTEVTQGQWQAVMSTTPWKENKNVQEEADYPVTYVSWDDAQDFCKKLSQKEGTTYRLPSEAEWEYACRGGQKTRYCFSESESSLSAYAWFDKNASEIGEKYAHKVGLKKANPFGLFDMHGNVYEWCEDIYTSKVPGGSDPLVTTGGSDRVNRSGSWLYGAALCRSAYRFWDSPGYRYFYVGFRVVRVPSNK